MPDLEDLLDVFGTYFVHERFPRPIAENLQWIGGCSALFLDKSKPDLVHSALNTYLIIGSEKTLLIDTGHPGTWPGYGDALVRALDGRTLDYVMPTHPEIPHAGALTLLYDRYPEMTVVGDVRDYFLYHPDIPESSYRPMGAGESLDLGDRRFEFLPALFKDLNNTVWGFDHGTGTLFCADGFAYFHWHSEGSCGYTTDELGITPDAEKYAVMTEIVSGISMLDLTEKIAAFESLIETMAPTIIAPAHGTVVTDIPAALTYLDALRNVSLTDSTT
jgi:flavorubredoxin